MFTWYAESEICYAFLNDINFTADIGPSNVWFAKSQWFSRGWTLQELLAPSHLLFFDRSWKEVGSKSDLGEQLAKVTGIDAQVLRDSSLIFKKSLAVRMSWAAKRETTRIEDTAYCLLGIFDVNMPLLYGEGGKAFFRLQEEIMKRSNDDHTLLAWGFDSKGEWDPQGDHFKLLPDDKERSSRYTTSLASSPALFDSDVEILAADGGELGNAIALQITEKGYRASLPLLIGTRLAYHGGSNQYFSTGEDKYSVRLEYVVVIALIPCRPRNKPRGYLGILLYGSTERRKFKRMTSKNGWSTIMIPLSLASTAVVEDIYISKSWDSNLEAGIFRQHYEVDLSTVIHSHRYKVTSMETRGLHWDPVNQTLLRDFVSQWTVKKDGASFAGMALIGLRYPDFDDELWILFDNQRGISKLEVRATLSQFLGANDLKWSDSFKHIVNNQFWEMRFQVSLRRDCQIFGSRTQKIAINPVSFG
jgi:hypothetical protein